MGVPWFVYDWNLVSISSFLQMVGDVSYEVKV